MIQHLLNNVYADPIKLLFCQIFLGLALVVTLLGMIITIISMIRFKKIKKALDEVLEEVKIEYQSIYSDIKEETIPIPAFVYAVEAGHEELLAYIRKSVIKFDIISFIIVILIAI